MRTIVIHSLAYLSFVVSLVLLIYPKTESEHKLNFLALELALTTFFISFLALGYILNNLAFLQSKDRVKNYSKSLDYEST